MTTIEKMIYKPLSKLLYILLKNGKMFGYSGKIAQEMYKKLTRLNDTTYEI